MKKRQRTRRLWLQIHFKAPGASRKKILTTLLESIENGTYKYPKGWKIILQWRNKEFAEMRTGEFTREMRDSRRSSPGFDFAVTNYLENLL